MNIISKTINNLSEYYPIDKPCLYITSDKETADGLRKMGEAVCIEISCEDDLSLFEGYNYFITSDGSYSGHLNKIYCHIKGIPFKIAETSRFIIREEKLSDLDEIYKLYDNEEAKRFLEPLPPRDSFDAKERLETVLSGYMLYDFGMWVIESLETGEIIGRAGFEYKSEDEVTIGFLVSSKERKKGIAYEACLCILNYLSEVRPDLKVTAVVSKDNLPSVSLLTKLNINFETT